jgi:hypothetical protein
LIIAMRFRDWNVTVGVFLIALAAFSLARSRLVSLDAGGPAQARYLTGDEPAYMLLTHSLVTDGDFNLYNNRVEKDGRFFGMEKTDAHGARKDWEQKEIYSIHTPGLAILLAPAYASGLYGPLAPRTSVCIFLNLLAALLAVNVYLFCSEIAGCADDIAPPKKRASLPALACTAVVILTPPILFYSNLVYPELPAALFLLYALRRSLTVRSPSRTGWLVAVLATSFLPWLSFRFLLPALLLLWLLLKKQSRGGRSRFTGNLTACLLFIISLTIFFFYQYHAFGSLNPAAGYLYQGFDQRGVFSKGLLDGIVGVVLDRGHGVLTWSPVYILSLTGLLLMLREQRNLGIWLIIILLAIYIPGASFIFWWGGFAPPPRYMVVPAPLLAGAICYALSRKPRSTFAIVFGLLFALSLLFGCYASLYPSLLYRHRHIITNYHPHLMIKLFPSFFRKRNSTVPLAAAWTACILIVNGYFFITWRRCGGSEHARLGRGRRGQPLS